MVSLEVQLLIGCKRSLGCTDGRTTLLGLEARVTVVRETITNSTIGRNLSGIVQTKRRGHHPVYGGLCVFGAAACESFLGGRREVWWTRRRCLRIYNRIKMDSGESFLTTAGAL